MVFFSAAQCQVSPPNHELLLWLTTVVTVTFALAFVVVVYFCMCAILFYCQVLQGAIEALGMQNTRMF